MTRTITAPAEFPPTHLGHQLKDLNYHKDTMSRVVTRKGSGINDSSDDLVSATYDEMMYGRRQSTRSEGRSRKQSFHATTNSDGDISVDLTIPIPKRNLDV